jgi:hypothetical protein
VHGLLRSIHLSNRAWIGGIHHYPETAHARNQLRKGCQQLGTKIRGTVATAGGIAAGMCKTRRESRPDRV